MGWLNPTIISFMLKSRGLGFTCQFISHFLLPINFKYQWIGRYH